jgi:UDP-N-acetylmuramate dehydrogenase
MPTTADKLKERFGTQFKENEPLAKHVNFRIGGPAKYFVEARSTQDLIDVVRLANELSLPYFILGGGSNTLVSDEGYQGLVIKAANRNTRIEGDRVTAEAGVISATVARATADKGLRGFEWAISLPGTIGGAVRGNAGCFGGEIKDTLESVKLLRDGEVIDVPVADMDYGYRHSLLKDAGHEQDVVLEATFKLVPGDRAEALAQIDKNLAGRKASQPLGSSSAGCMFKNFEYRSPDEIAKLAAKVEIPEKMTDMHRIGAGWMIDQLGLKGTKMGEAQIAPQHGNFLLNVGHATAKDIVSLISFVKTKARDEFGVQLQEEVQYLGF